MTPPTPTRRAVLGAGLATAAVATTTTTESAAAASDDDVRALETTYDTTIGLVARNLATGATIAHRPDERFPLLSTFKVLAAAAILDRGVDLDRLVRYTEADVVVNSPVTAARRAMTYGELCDAAIRYSDNTAGNLLLRRLGGPRGLTRFARTTGDHVTRLDRWEPELNTATPGDPRDTTTPRAIARTYERLLRADVLGARDRWVLTGWMQSNTTSVATTRTGLPQGWWFADKTGSGSYGTMNDVGLATAPDGTRVLLAVLTRRSTTDPAAQRDPRLLADLARLTTTRLA